MPSSEGYSRVLDVSAIKASKIGLINYLFANITLSSPEANT